MGLGRVSLGPCGLPAWGLELQGFGFGLSGLESTASGQKGWGHPWSRFVRHPQGELLRRLQHIGLVAGDPNHTQTKKTFQVDSVGFPS